MLNNIIIHCQNTLSSITNNENVEETLGKEGGQEEEGKGEEEKEALGFILFFLVLYF